MAKDKPVYAFIRKGNALIPEMEIDIAALDGIAQGQRVRIDIKHWRNFDRLRAYWAMLREVVQATECAPNATVLHEEIKMNVGLVQFIRAHGMMVQIPASIAIEAMREPDMIKFFEAAERYLAQAYGYTGKDAA